MRRWLGRSLHDAAGGNGSGSDSQNTEFDWEMLAYILLNAGKVDMLEQYEVVCEKVTGGTRMQKY